MEIEILVVDNDLRAANDFAKMLSRRTSLLAKATDSPKEALDLIRSEPIKLVVLDQRMPEKSGTELFKDIVKINPYIRGIMLTGEAEPAEIMEAYTIGFAASVQKSNLRSLPGIILSEYARYHANMMERELHRTSVVIMSESHGFVMFRKRIDYILDSVEITNQDFVNDDHWVTVKQIHTGESMKEEDTIELEAKYLFEQNLESKMMSKMGISTEQILKLNSSLEATISEKLKTSFTIGTKRTVKRTWEMKLPDEPANPAGLFVVSRHYQRAPVYIEIRCIVIRKCRCCGVDQPISVIVYATTTKIATRIKDFLSDNSTIVRPTGIESY